MVTETITLILYLAGDIAEHTAYEKLSHCLKSKRTIERNLYKDTGIALVKSAVDGIKSAIGTAQDISEIAGHIDNLFEGESQVQKARNKKSGVDQFNIKSVAQETIDARIAQEKLYEMSQMIDMRFGHGTWQGIVTERAKRIQEAKEAALAARKKKAKEQAELVENIKMGAIIFGAIAAIIAAAVGMIISAAKAVGINQ